MFVPWGWRKGKGQRGRWNASHSSEVGRSHFRPHACPKPVSRTSPPSTCWENSPSWESLQSHRTKGVNAGRGEEPEWQRNPPGGLQETRRRWMVTEASTSDCWSDSWSRTASLSGLSSCPASLRGLGVFMGRPEGGGEPLWRGREERSRQREHSEL